MYPTQSAATFIKELIVMDAGSLECSAKSLEGVAADLASRTNELQGISTHWFSIQLGHLYFEETGELDYRYPPFISADQVDCPKPDRQRKMGRVQDGPPVTDDNCTTYRHTHAVRKAGSSHSLHTSGKQIHSANVAQTSKPHRLPLSGTAAETP